MNEMSWPPQVPPPSPMPPPMPVAFSGSRSDFFHLVKRGAALELVTLGFYRFWLLTDIRRHLWSNTLVDGDAAEYTGRGKELLIGFLVALAILVPIYLGYFLIGLEARFGLDLCLAGVAVGSGDDPHARADPAVARGGARTVQDAPFPFRRSSR